MNLTTLSTRSPAISSRAPLPLNEKQRFASVIASLRELSSALEVGLPLHAEQLDPPYLVEELGRVLTHHCEDAEAWLRTVAQRRLDLLPAVVDMRTDHAILAEALWDLRLIASDAARWGELPPRISSLLATLESHCQVESHLARGSVRPYVGVD